MVLAMMHPTGESRQSQGKDRHETEPLIEASKKSLWKMAKTLTSRNLHAAIMQSMGTGPFTSKWLQTRYRLLKIVFHNCSQLQQQCSHYLMFTLNLTV